MSLKKKKIYKNEIDDKDGQISVSQDKSQEDRGSLGHNFKMVWTLIGICILVVVVGWVLGLISTAIWAIVISGFIVFLLKNPVSWLSKKGVPRGLATGVLVLFLIAAIIAIFVSFIPLVFDQAVTLVQKIPSYIAQFESWWESFIDSNPEFASNPIVSSWATQAAQTIASMASSFENSFLTGALGVGKSIVNIVFVGFTSFLVAFWILIDYDRMTQEVHIVAGKTSEWYLVLFSTIISRVLGGFIKGTLIGALITAAISGIGYWILGLPSPVVLGILTGLLSIVPYLGPFIATIAIAILAIFTSPLAFVVSIVISILVPWIVSTFISPKIMSSTVNLHPGITMLAIIAGGAAGGMIGMVLAIPIAAIAKCIFVYFFESITGRQVVTKEGALFYGSPTDSIDPVADATDNYLNELKLAEIVEENELKIRKIENMPKRRVFTLFRDLAKPIDRDRDGVADSELHEDSKNR